MFSTKIIKESDKTKIVYISNIFFLHFLFLIQPLVICILIVHPYPYATNKSMY